MNNLTEQAKQWINFYFTLAINLIQRVKRKTKKELKTYKILSLFKSVSLPTQPWKICIYIEQYKHVFYYKSKIPFFSTFYQ